MNGDIGSEPREAKSIPPSPYGISCYLKDGLLRCERRLLEGTTRGARGNGRAPRSDPQRDTRSSRGDEPAFTRDSAMQQTMDRRSRAMPRKPRDHSSLDFPAGDQYLGSLIQGSAHPPPGYGQEFSEPSLPVAVRPAPRTAAAATQPRARPSVNVPVVSSMMYSD